MLFDHYDAHGLPTTCEETERALAAMRGLLQEADAKARNLAAFNDELRRANDGMGKRLAAARASVARLEQAQTTAVAEERAAIAKWLLDQAYGDSSSDATVLRWASRAIGGWPGIPGSFREVFATPAAPAGDGAAETGEHVIETFPVPKMDTPSGLFNWSCSCGKVGNVLGSERHARKAGNDHHAAKTHAAPLPSVGTSEVSGRG